MLKGQNKDNRMDRNRAGKMEDIFLITVFLAALLFMVVYWK